MTVDVAVLVARVDEHVLASLEELTGLAGKNHQGPALGQQHIGRQIDRQWIEPRSVVGETRDSAQGDEHQRLGQRAAQELGPERPVVAPAVHEPSSRVPIT